MLTSLASAKAGRPVRRPTRYEKLARPVRAATRPVMDLAELRTERFFEDKNRAFWILQATGWGAYFVVRALGRSEEHTSELQSLMRISYAVFCLKKKKTPSNILTTNHI